MGHSQSLSIALDQINLHVSDRDTSGNQQLCLKSLKNRELDNAAQYLKCQCQLSIVWYK